MHESTLDELRNARYTLLRSFRRDGTPVDTPIWFGLDGRTVPFRTKVGPKTKRLTAHPEVELTACDHRDRAHPGATTVAARATFLSGAEAELANRTLHERYGWRWNIVPLIKVPGVTNVNRHLSVREKLRRTRHRAVWPDFVIVLVKLGLPASRSQKGAW